MSGQHEWRQPPASEDPRVTAALAEIAAQVAAEQAADGNSTPAPTRRRAYADVRTDLEILPLFREAVRVTWVRQEAARGRAVRGGTWQGQYTRIWHEQWKPLNVPPPPDYALGRFAGVADDVVARALAAVETAENTEVRM